MASDGAVGTADRAELRARGLASSPQSVRLESGGRILSPSRPRRDGMYLVGRNGRLFLARDSSRTSSSTRDSCPGRCELGPGTTQLERRTARLQAAGVPYVLMIAPNAHAVYPEDLPEGVVTAARRPVHQLLELLVSRNASTRVLYPLEELLAEKAKREVYPRTNTHWKTMAPWSPTTAWPRSWPAPSRCARWQRTISCSCGGEFRGDLGVKRRWSRRSTHVAALARYPAARLVEDNQVLNTGSRLVFECTAAPPGTCLASATRSLGSASVPRGELSPARGGHASGRGLGGRGRGAAERRDHGHGGAISRRSPGRARRFVRADSTPEARGEPGPGSDGPLGW